jgi:hypothetical protein
MLLYFLFALVNAPDFYAVQVFNETETLPSEHFQEVLDFVGFLKVKHLRKIPETVLLSESALAKDWDTSEEDEAWGNL